MCYVLGGYGLAILESGEGERANNVQQEERGVDIEGDDPRDEGPQRPVYERPRNERIDCGGGDSDHPVFVEIPNRVEIAGVVYAPVEIEHHRGCDERRGEIDNLPSSPDTSPPKEQLPSAAQTPALNIL